MPKVLIVDDNNENLRLTGQMLNRLKISSDQANSGFLCIELLKKGYEYDLILMDYMMEGMDGIETTKRIRAMGGSFSSIPIIAFTANGTESLKQEYLAAGMNDYLIKPVETDALEAILNKYISGSVETGHTEIVYDEASSYPELPGVSREDAIKYSGGNLVIYKEILASFFAGMAKNEAKIRNAYEKKDMKNFVVEVHGIKSAARTAGMNELSEKMAMLEKAGNELNIEYINENLEGTLQLYFLLAERVRPFFEEKMQGKRKAVTDDPVEKKLIEIRDLLDDFETEEAKKILEALSEKDFDITGKSILQRLKTAFEEDDYYSSLDYVDELLDTYLE